MRKLRVLHFGNIAGVPILLVKGLRKKGIKANVVQRRQHKRGFESDIILTCSVPKFLIYLLRMFFNYDIIHIHAFPYKGYFDIYIFILKLTRKKVVQHVHSIRFLKNLSTRIALKIANRVIVATPNLKFIPRSTYLPNPIDPYFKNFKTEKRGALYFKQWYETEEKARKRWSDLKIEEPLTIHAKNVLHSKMPMLLNKFKYFIDQQTFNALSKTALEALACGCIVIDYKGDFVNPDLIQEHSIEKVTDKLIEIYHSMTRNK